MATQPIDWNVVIIGAWNIAILTPDGIRKRLFNAPEGTPVDIQVAVDRPAPHRVHYNSLTVSPSSEMLIISVDQCNVQSLKRACEVGARALSQLPETPLSAVGINFRYRIDELPNDLLTLIDPPIDELFSDRNYIISRRSIQRGLELQPGVINLELGHEQTTEGTILLNFNLDSQDRGSIEQWLSKVQEFFDKSQELLTIMNIPAPEGETTND